MVATVTDTKWGVMEMFIAINKVVNPTPTIPPVLQSPWKEPLILRLNCFCSVMACVFMAMLRMRILKANRQMASTSETVVVAKLMSDRQIACITKPTDKGTLLSNLVTSQPEKGRPIRELIGMASRIVPNSASLKPKEVRMVGILAAQLEKQNPERKKNVLREIRCLVLKSILHDLSECKYPE